MRTIGITIKVPTSAIPAIPRPVKKLKTPIVSFEDINGTTVPAVSILLILNVNLN